MPHSLLIIGTDTDAGKTVAACGIVAHLRLDRGINILPAKPVQTGCTRLADGSLTAPDLDAHLDAAGLAAPPPHLLGLMSPYRFEPACSPHLAAAETGITVEPATIRDAMRALADTCDGVVAETAGGLLTPLNPRGETMLDLARLLGWPVLLVAANRLGCINHALLSLRALAAAEIPVIGVLTSLVAPPSDDSLAAAIRRDNPRAIARFGGVPYLGQIPFLPHAAGRTPHWRTLTQDAPALARTLRTIFPVPPNIA